MRKIFLTLCVACFVVTLTAAELPNQGFGVQIGWAQPILRLNDPNLLPKDSLMNVTKLNGFKVGVVYDASFVAGFGSSIGINYTFGAGNTAWRKKTVTQPTNYPQVRDKTMYHEMDIFVDWQYKFELAKETYIILYTGPTIQCGIAFDAHRDERDLDGHVKADPLHSTQYYTTTEDNKALKRLNVTWGVGAGFQYQRYFLRGGYDFGLLNPYMSTKYVNVTDDRYTRGRFDQWSIKIGMYIWYNDK